MTGRTTLNRFARTGLVVRGGFYLVLSYLAVEIALMHRAAAQQADAHGALADITRSALGKGAVAVAAAGFFAFGIARLTGAWRDRQPPLWRRSTTALQGAFYLGLAYVPLSFLLGNRQTGSEQQQHKNAARLLGFPGGQELVVVLGLVVIVVCGWQIRTALSQDYTDGMRLSAAPRWVNVLVHFAGTVGIAARALVFLPMGVFLIVAGVQYDPKRADGLDEELLRLSRHTWGLAVIAAATAGLLVFALFSLLEARFRDLSAGK